VDDFHELRSPGRFPGVFGCVDWIHNAIWAGARLRQLIHYNTIARGSKWFAMTVYGSSIALLVSRHLSPLKAVICLCVILGKHSMNSSG
jgi:hypothetical protein